MSTVRERPVQAFWIDDYEVDPNSLTLTGPAGETSLEPKIMEVLVELVTYAGEVVTRQDLVERVWKVSYGGDESLTRAISILRKQLKPAEGQEDPIETVPRRGYKLRAKVRFTIENADQSVETSEAGPVSPDLTEGAPKPDARGASRIFALVSIPVAIILVIGLWVYLASGERSPEVGAVLAELELSEEVNAHYDELAPGFSEGLTSVNRRLHVLASEGETPRYRISLSMPTENEGDAIRMALFVGASGDPVLVSDFSLAGQSGDKLAERLLINASHAIRCGDELVADAFSARRTNVSFMAMVFDMCIATGTEMSDASMDARTERMLANYPDDPGVKALHAVGLLLRPQRHMMGRRDLREDEVLRTAGRLLTEAEAAGHTSNLLQLGKQLLTVYSADLAGKEALLTGFEAEGWLSARAQIYLRTAGLRRSGRLTEALYILENAQRLWPADKHTWANQALTLAMQGLTTEALDVMAESSLLFPDSPDVAQLSEILTIYYGENEAADLLLAYNVPPFLVPCFSTFRDILNGADEDLSAVCDRLDPVSRARLNAIVGNYDTAFLLMEQFDPEALGVGFTLHYAEMLPLWKEDRMWDLAEDFGMMEYWRTTRTRPDFCYGTELISICDAAFASGEAAAP